jgi:hypothetical protein
MSGIPWSSPLVFGQCISIALGVCFIFNILMIDADCKLVIKKRILSKLYQQTSMTRSDVTRLQADIEELKINMVSRINRIPECFASLSEGVISQQGRYDNNPVLNNWVRLSISAMFDLFWSIIYMPLNNSNITEVWPEFKSR